MNCPNCSAPMDRMALEGIYGPRIEIDVCYTCHLLWLDRRESVQLSPGGTLDLFRALHEHGDEPRHNLSGRSQCPRCASVLELVQDFGLAGRFSYYLCPEQHGRLTPFSEFLKEKKFVRELNAGERQRVADQVRQVQCSRCGAPIELQAGFECGHCGSPLTVLDPDAVEATLRELQDSDARRKSVSPEEAQRRARALAAMEGLRTHPEAAPWGRGLSTGSGHGLGVDLLTASIRLLFRGI